MKSQMTAILCLVFANNCGAQKGPANPAEHLDSPIALCGAGISFSDEVQAKLEVELNKTSPNGGLTVEFKRAARTAVELQDNAKYASYLHCICQKSNIQTCDTTPPANP